MFDKQKLFLEEGKKNPKCHSTSRAVGFTMDSNLDFTITFRA